MKVEAATVRDDILYLLLRDVGPSGQRVVGTVLLGWTYDTRMGMETFTFRTVERPNVPEGFFEKLRLLNESDNGLAR